jgi:putative PIN family toxin of toxin-antitoxin system
LKIVFDTNVLISAAISSGKSFEILIHCLKNHIVFTSRFILSELEEKLAGKFHFAEREILEFRDTILEEVIIVSPASVPAVIPQDPDDDHILAAALTGNCDCIISGDKHLLNVQEYQRIPIIRPGQFFDFEANFKE